MIQHADVDGAFDPNLVGDWLSGRSLARGLASPVQDRGGWRVDTGLPDERARWVFAAPCEGLAALGREITRPYFPLKLTGTSSALIGLLPRGWELMPEAHFMATTDDGPGRIELPAGYRMDLAHEGGRGQVRIFDDQGEEAAGGFCAETPRAFVYDRIRTAVVHRRRGLGRAVMAALGSLRKDRAAAQLLTATAEGRALYESIGWRVLSPYVTAAIPALPSSEGGAGE